MAIPVPDVKTWVGDKARAVIYSVYGVLSVALGAIHVGFAAAEVGQPVWLKVATAVFAFLGGALGYTAATHTPRESEVARLRG